MSGDAGSYAMENANPTERRLTWKDITREKWEKKAAGCLCKPQETRFLQDYTCRLIKVPCEMDVCPFVYWGCLY